MMRLILCALAIQICIANCTKAQNQFNFYTDTANLSNGFRGILKKDNGYIISSYIALNPNPNQAALIETDESNNSNLNYGMVIKDSIKPYFFSSSIISFNNKYYTFGSTWAKVDSTTFRARGLVYIFNINKDTVKTILIPDTAYNGQCYPYSIIHFNDYIYCTGYKSNVINGIASEKTILIKLDTLGNIIWQKLINSAYKYSSGVNLKAANNKLYLSGYEYNQTNQWHSYLCNLSENGDTSNVRHLNDSQYINKVFPNGDYIMSGQKAFQNILLQYSGAGYIVKYSSNGLKLWEKEYLNNSLWEFALRNEIFNDAQGNLYFYGDGRNPAENNYAASSSKLKFFILKTTANGDSLWMKRYSRDDAHMYPSGWVQNDDGGFTVCGSVQGPNIPGSWDAWLMRVDSNGCIDEFCTPVGIKEESFEREEALNVYPNPANDYINFESNETINKIEISNVHGQVIDNINGNSIDNYHLSISNYKTGIYFYHITLLDKTTIHGKILIQH